VRKAWAVHSIPYQYRVLILAKATNPGTGGWP
jgi:hypothetical protein